MEKAWTRSRRQTAPGRKRKVTSHQAGAIAGREEARVLEPGKEGTCLAAFSSVARSRCRAACRRLSSRLRSGPGREASVPT
jgi:hypothetical protein